MILIFTNKEDAHPNLVIDILIEWGVPFFRLNTEDLLTEYSFQWWVKSSDCDFEIEGRKNGIKVKGSEITAVWDRRPELPTTLLFHNTDQIDKHNLKEALGFLQFLRYYLRNVPSIGSIVEDRVASSKMLQYRVAIDCGFTVPDTVFSNTKEAIISFAQGKDTLCLKSIEGTDIWDEETALDYVFYTQLIPGNDIPDIPEEAFSQTVSFVQEYVQKEFELRVTVVGTDVFATKILSQELSELKGKVDWRQGYEHGLKWEPFDLPKEIEQKCLAVVRSLGLNFGCFDLIVRPDGEFVFLECNPNGQWLWIELTTGQPISKSIASFLSS